MTLRGGDPAPSFDMPFFMDEGEAICLGAVAGGTAELCLMEIVAVRGLTREPLVLEDDGTADATLERCDWSLSTDPSDCQSIPCCCLSCTNCSRRREISSVFDRRVFSGWCHSTTR